mgnify:CR=1 FL=1
MIKAKVKLLRDVTYYRLEDDINDFLNSLKTNKNMVLDLISFDDLYQGYKAYFKAKGVLEQKAFLIVSKQYLEQKSFFF